MNPVNRPFPPSPSMYPVYGSTSNFHSTAWPGAGGYQQAAAPAMSAPSVMPPRPVFQAPVVEETPVVRRTEAAEMRYANIFIRFIAYALDAVILGLIEGVLAAVVMGLSFALGYLAGRETGAFMMSVGAYLLLIPAVIIVAFAYFVIQETSASRATFGKQIMGLQVVNLSGGTITTMQALGRILCKSLLNGLCFWVALFTQRRQAVHDLIVETVVVER